MYLDSSMTNRRHDTVPSLLLSHNPSGTLEAVLTGRYAELEAINTTRYGYLRPSAHTHWRHRHKYVFTLNLRQCVDLLPRLMGSIVEAIRFLGPKHCALSIIEGNSDDGTLEVLRLLKTDLSKMGVDFWLASSSIDPKAGDDRIKQLAILRSLALEPVTRLDLAPDAAIIFINDVAACAEDLLELIHQKSYQSADMVCAMDWWYADFPNPSELPTFYDVWVSRDMNGAFYFDIPTDTGSWDFSHDLFPHEPIARARFGSGQPFQVFSCWNGAVAFSARPLVEGKVNFRWPKEGECFQGEPQLFCKDLWWEGFGRIAVVPSVNLAYNTQEGKRIKKELGFVSDFVSSDRIDWRAEPPAQVCCAPGFKGQKWLDWDESLVNNTNTVAEEEQDI
ncbi:family 69 glycosyltransferase [Apodospora peruviana]|uniref:Family 69 glycosyltransferase n=1 Tax=Apodospora peruviana TaxID=516989 RepID=A0AAE0I6N5_9PEZI|nr:family 69 glycosyltransferase [Apodospora peruviana]